MAEESDKLEVSLRPILDQMIAAKDSQLHFVALMIALTLPDICASLSADDGSTSREKYIAWLKDALVEAADPAWIAMGGPPDGEAELIYGLRCSFLHQGRLDPHRSDVVPIFVVPNNTMHSHANYVIDPDGKLTHVTYVISNFVVDIANAVSRWIQNNKSDETVLTNLEQFASIRPGGYPGIISGVPVVM